jgi:hypothetical protein
MSTPFLDAFSRALVQRLVDDGQLVVAEGALGPVAVYLAEDLAKDQPGRSLVSSVSRALLACPSVEDLFASDDAIKAAIETLGRFGG